MNPLETKPSQSALTTTVVIISFFYWLYLVKAALGIDVHPDAGLHLYKP